MKKMLSALLVCFMVALIMPAESPAGGTTTIPEPTIAPASVTGCPVVMTECAVVETECPIVETECPIAKTVCPTAPTICTDVETECPELPTICPDVPTECPVEKTQCPSEPTICTEIKTECPELPTICPEIPTECPVDDPACDKGEGCTPGYWKVRQHFDSWVGYSPDMDFSAVFGRTITISWKMVGRPMATEDPSLLQALWANGGGINALARHAVAALLNASSPDVAYAYTVGQIIDMVQAAIDSGDYGPTKDMLEEENDPTPCPLN